MSSTILLRPSELARFADCETAGIANGGLADQLEIGDMLKQTRTHVAAAIGTGVHKGVETALRRKRLRQPHHLDLCVEAALLAYEADVAAAGGPSNMVWDQTSKPADAPRQIERMVKAWCAYRLDELTPILIEKRMMVRLNGGFVLSGQLDQAFDLPNAIHDLFTGGQDAVKHLQLGLYAVIRETVTGSPVERIAVDHVQRLPMTRSQTPPTLTIYDSDACKSAARALLSRAMIAITNWRTERQRFLVNPASKLCSSRWCAAFGSDLCGVTRSHR